MAYVVNFHEAKTQLSQLIERAAQEERIIIAKAGKPVAELIPHRERPVTLGGLQGRLEYDDAAFDSTV